MGIPQGFVFLKGTDYYRTMNATMNMSEKLNGGDELFDGRSDSEYLRTKSLVLVNHSAQGGLTPDRGIVEFMELAIGEIKSAIRRLPPLPQKAGERRALELYAEYFEEFKEEVEEDPAFLENFLNISIARGRDSIPQQRLLQIRYTAIRNAQFAQSAILQKIEGVKTWILNGYAKPPHFKAAFQAVMIEQTRTVEDRQRLEKLFNFSPFDFEARLSTRGGSRTKFMQTKANLLHPTYLGHIQFLCREVLQDMRTLRTQEEYQRAQTIKDLRWAKGWQQWRLGLELKAIFATAAASQPTICRIETRKKLVTPLIAQQFSQVFGVDPGLFMPHFFYD